MRCAVWRRNERESRMSETAAAERPPLAERLKQNADGILEQIARDYGVSTFDVVHALPEEHRAILPGSRFEEVLQALTALGRGAVHRAHARYRAGVRRQRSRRALSGAAISICTATARSAGTSRRRTASTSCSSAVRSWAGRRARCSSSTAPAKPCSRSSCAGTRSAICCSEQVARFDALRTALIGTG